MVTERLGFVGLVRKVRRRFGKSSDPKRCALCFANGHAIDLDVPSIVLENSLGISGIVAPSAVQVRVCVTYRNNQTEELSLSRESNTLSFPRGALYLVCKLTIEIISSASSICEVTIRN